MQGYDSVWFSPLAPLARVADLNPGVYTFPVRDQSGSFAGSALA